MLVMGGRREVDKPPARLKDGKGNQQDVRTVSPAEGFPHVGIYQSSLDLWSRTFAPVWHRLLHQASRIMKAEPPSRSGDTSLITYRSRESCIALNLTRR